jgi:hypothetical protein
MLIYEGKLISKLQMDIELKQIRVLMFKRAEQMEVSWSKVGAIRRMLEDFPLEISQRLICLVGSMGMRIVMQVQLGTFGKDAH